MAVTKVNLGSYTINLKEGEKLKHNYDVLSVQADGGYFVNSPDGKVIEVGIDGEGKANDETPQVGEDVGSSSPPEPGTKAYTLGDIVWTINANHTLIKIYTATSNDDEYIHKTALHNKEAEKLDFIWLSPSRIVGYGDYRVESCTTETACLKKGVQIFELGGDDKIAHQKVQIKRDSYGLGEDKVIGGFRLLEDGSKCFWLWNAAGELNFVKSEDQPETGKKIWKSWKYHLTFSNRGVEVVEFDFDIAISPVTGGLLAPKYIVVIAKGSDGKLGLYTALPD